MTFTAPTAIADIGVTGLGVMGANLARNLARNGFKVAVHNRSIGRTQRLIADHGAEGEFFPAESVENFVASLSTPRVAIIMVQAGPPTDAVIEQLAAHMDPGDIIVDCGNSQYQDTRRREASLRERGLHFVGAGVSGGEEGALLGPAIMPGGTVESYDRLGPMFEAIAAKADGEPCCTHVGPDGAGHFVKMVHNGIEYADMQLITEAYDIMRTLGMSAPEIGGVFAEWNTGDLESYLIDVTAEVLRHEDAKTGRAFVDILVDRASQKGTGAWTVQTAAALGVPVTGIAEATFARSLSGSVAQRAAAAQTLPGHAEELTVADRTAFIEDVRRALYASKMVAYSQGFELIRAASDEYGWGVKLGEMAKIWRAGCIIRARFLDRITEAYTRDAELPLLLADEFFVDAINDAVPAWRRVVTAAFEAGIPVPAFASSLAYYDGVRAPRSSAALIQAQRDLFGSHTYQRVDMAGTFHTRWSADRAEEQWD
ncbi:NADP-dependent phosphogluconate dehydrogenase [Trueperella pyogenes]|uniref:6-phosphogluconate dehydrogenase, decarboxylating n=1 Tax=Trueperella pyogenes TaxID=1661 RepID=A0A3S9QM20_9ACTO|nr:NADP-dependent phosphogluconate dehydrogenase [Trueperella pyogenes]AWG03784.1 phosphogluconate dehydrogenase (NADP(+)-dependent, decarboxylating) [Trueperella pyogenes]AWG16515.1 phosphogluconate dehydrogenase (NADP(+)-dependent, decarboxylating) [Trueperella pyogenes]AZR05393.1 NADP-dependent phosphogluconate dehydrogenase [Trueperella pyogenes]AZR06974.1 NADP-dependent phosphogluconate dehydrogenase [Trueperella pyogenes]MCI7689917.1 NADP-dependent phosphogluconate dehydrogenase [Trueper